VARKTLETLLGDAAQQRALEFAANKKMWSTLLNSLLKQHALEITRGSCSTMRKKEKWYLETQALESTKARLYKCRAL